MSAIWPKFETRAFREDGFLKADVINLDLEDSVAPPNKVEARQNISKAIII